MNPYHKINSLFLRDMERPGKPFKMWEWARPELGYLSANEWHFTEKIDGTNVRVMYDGIGVKIGGRTDNAQMPLPLVDRLRELFPPEKIGEHFDGNVTLYGEGFGPKIQKVGHLYGDQQDFALFDVRVEHFWLKPEDVTDVARKLGCLCVPYLGTGTLFEAIEMAKGGIQSRVGNLEAEGIVARPMVRLFDGAGRRIITKVKTRDFLP